MAASWGIGTSGAFAALGRKAPMTGSAYGTDCGCVIEGTCGVATGRAKADAFSAPATAGAMEA